MPISDQHNAKIIKVTFKCPEFLSIQQKSAYSIDSFLRYSQCSCPVARVTIPIFHHTHANMNLHQCAKNQAFSSFGSRDIVNIKILQSDWLRASWSISQEPDFSQVWNLCKNTANIIKYLYRPNLEKIWLNFPVNSKHSVFGPFLAHFPHFWGKQVILKKSDPVTHNKTWAPNTTLSFRKN